VPEQRGKTYRSLDCFVLFHEFINELCPRGAL
jgi:hypothetical protein